MPSGFSLSNWSGNIQYEGLRLHRPTSVSELCDVVAGSSRIRAMGSRHSFSQVATTAGDLVTLEAIPAEVEIDAVAGELVVGGGVTFASLFERLREAGMALADLASLPHISVAGSLATGTHGSGHRRGGLASMVLAVERVSPDGELQWIGESDAEFPGAVIALGALGIATRMRLRCEPTYDVTQSVQLDVPLQVLVEDFDAVFDSAYSVSVFTDVASETGNVYLKRRTDHTYPGLDAGRPAKVPIHPVPGVPATWCTEQLGVPGPWCDRLPHFRAEFAPGSGDELQSEFFVPRVAASEALRALMSISAIIKPAIHVAEIRSVAAEAHWLSPAYDRDSITFHFTWYRDERTMSGALRAVEDVLAPFTPRPHWAKLTRRTPADLSACYPRMDDFARLRERCDPAGKFTNAFVDALLAPTSVRL